jgi:hypothetical protein
MWAEIGTEGGIMARLGFGKTESVKLKVFS